MTGAVDVKDRVPVKHLEMLVLMRMNVGHSGEPARREDACGRAAGEPIAQAAGIRLRLSHLQVFGNIEADGTRLTDLAAWAGMARPSMAELVDELEADGLLERRPDPSDGRAKLVVLTPAGWDAIRAGRAIIAGIEADYANRIGAERFETMCWALQDLLDDLNGAPVRGTPEAGESRRS